MQILPESEMILDGLFFSRLINSGLSCSGLFPVDEISFQWSLRNLNMLFIGFGLHRLTISEKQKGCLKAAFLFCLLLVNNCDLVFVF